VPGILHAQRMTLRDLMGNGAPEVEVSGLAYSSRSVTPGTLFFCVPGFRADGHDFAPDAVTRGAVALVCERPLGLGVPEVIVDDVRAAMGPAAARFHGDPTAELDVVGVTGTNGKTTTAFLVRHLLEADGRQTGLLGTVKRVVGGVEEEVERTTPEAIDLQATFRAMLDGGDRACAMEVSSHALELGRVSGIRFGCRIFTNLTQDHLDFHETMEAYFAAKRRLFEEGGLAVVNVDDEYGRRIAAKTDCISFAVCASRGLGPRRSDPFWRDADYRARDVEFDLMGSRFRCETPDGDLELQSPLPGLFNVQNVLGAVAAARSLGVPGETIAAALPSFGRVPGRFEPVDEGQDFGVLVDYAHTPEALENVLQAAREVIARGAPQGSPRKQGRLHVVFGAGGDRDRGKRPLMGEAARRLADRVVVTSDNPRSEPPEAIVDAIMEGAGPEAERETDRRRAIALAIDTAEPGDVVVIAGKGHEQGQEFANGRKEPFDDLSEARAALRARLGARA
jgi:UDP-N-acetylmuramoyl-L-alanyl-D-glutamate--2,6-diaminopimelate ligase